MPEQNQVVFHDILSFHEKIWYIMQFADSIKETFYPTFQSLDICLCLSRSILHFFPRDPQIFSSSVVQLWWIFPFLFDLEGKIFCDLLKTPIQILKIKRKMFKESA